MKLHWLLPIAVIALVDRPLLSADDLAGTPSVPAPTAGQTGNEGLVAWWNFEKIVAPEPRPLDPGIIVEMCSQIETMIQMQGSSQPGVLGDLSVVQAVRTYFESLN